MKNKIMLGLVIAILLLSMTFMVSAIDISVQDNPSPGNNPDYPIVKISEDKFLGIFGGAPISDIELIDNTDVCAENCYAILNVTIYQPTDNFINDVTFRKFNENQLEYVANNYNKKIYILQHQNKTESYIEKECIRNETYSIPVTKCQGGIGCHQENENNNLGVVCTLFNDITKTRIVDESTYVEYNGEELSPGQYTFKITGTKLPEETIDWVPTILNEKIEQLAWWNSTSKFGTGADGELMFTVSNKSYGNLVNGVDYSVSGNTLYLRLNRPYQFTKVTMGAGTTLSTTNTSGSVLYIMATDRIDLQGAAVNLNNVLASGNFPVAFSYLGDTFTTPSVASGGSSYSGQGQGNGAGGGGSSQGWGGGGPCAPSSGGTGGTGFPFGITSAASSVSYSSNGIFTGCNVANGGNGNASGGASGSPYAGLTRNSGSNSQCSGCSVTCNGYGGSGGSTYGANGGQGSGSCSANTNCNTACTWSYYDSGSGGGGAGGGAGKPGAHLVLRADNVTLEPGSIISLSGTSGTNGGIGGTDPFDGTRHAYPGGGGGGGSGGNLYVYYSKSFVNNATFTSTGGTGGICPAWTWLTNTYTCYGNGGAGSSGVLNLQRAGGSYITLNSPVNGTPLVIPPVAVFNATAEAYLTTYTNATFTLWYANGTVNQRQVQTLTGNGIRNLLFNVTSTNIPDGIQSWNVQVCSTDGALNYCVSNPYNFTFTAFSVQFANSSTYTNPTYEMINNTYTINATSTGFVNLSATFMWDGVTPYPATTSGNNINASFSVTINQPLNNPAGQSQNHSFHWHVLYGGQLKESNSENVSVLNSVYSICNFSTNSTLNIPFLNINYRDEVTNLPINATIIQSTWTYGIVGSPYSEQYLYSSPNLNGSQVTALQHQFCFYPPFASINIPTATYQYGNPNLGYSTKIWPFNDLALTNSSATTFTLYLINLVDSGTTPVTFQALSSQTNTVVPNVRVQVYRTIGGTQTLVDDGYTDAAGTVSYYLSPITAYTVIAFGGGCNQLTSTITPTSSQYNLLLNCANQAAQQFATPIDGIRYTRTPADGINTPGTQVYTFNVYNDNTNESLQRVKFSLVDAITRQVFATNDSLANTASCNATTCGLTLTYTTYTGDNLKGMYYVSINGTDDSDLVLIEGDAYWRFIKINQNNSVNAIGRLMMQLQDFFGTWGTATVDCGQYTTQFTCSAVTECKWVNETVWAPKESQDYQSTLDLCIPRDDLNKQEFNRIFTIFFVLVIVLFILGRTTGYELNHPGAFVVAMSAIIWILSLYGMFTFNGLTQYPFFNQYIFALTTSCIGAGYGISIIRRYSG